MTSTLSSHLERLAREVRYAVRSLFRARVVTAVAVGSLALGIGSAAAIFSLVEAAVWKPLAYHVPERLLFVREVWPPLEKVYPTLPANIQHFRFWRAHARSTTDMAAFVNGAVTLSGAGEPELLDSAETTANLFAVLGVGPRTGRSFVAAEEQPGHNRVVVITDRLWHRRFAASPHLVGSAILLDGVPHMVVGILPPSFHFPRRDDLGPLAKLGERVEVFRPLGQTFEGWGGDYDYTVFARLAPRASAAQARAELDVLEDRIDKEHQLGARLHVAARPLQEVLAAPVRAGLYALLAAVGILLAIVCVNLANLVLARGSVRARELSIRVALGASRAGLVREIVVETVVLALAGGVLGLAAAAAALRAFVAAAPVAIPRLDEAAVDHDVVLFALGLSLACGLVSGLFPARRLAAMAPTAAVDPRGVLRAGGRSLTESRRTMRLREVLVGCEVGASAALLVLAGLLIGSFARLLRVDKGFQVERAIAVHLVLPDARYPSREQRTSFFLRALERVRSLPGVRSAAFISKPPLTGESNVNEIQLEGADQSVVDPLSRGFVMINVRHVSPGYFATLGIPLVRGRDVEPRDRDRAVSVVSARLAAKVWPGSDPLGKRFSTGSGVGKVEVVGVARDVPNASLEQGPTLIAYVPYWLNNSLHSGDIAVRTAIAPAALVPSLRRAIRSLDPGLPSPPMRTMAEIVSGAVSQRLFQMQLAAGFALSALLLALLGIYGVVSYTVAQRRGEIGVRMALGARLGQVMRLVVGRGLRPVALGLAAGIAAAVAGGQLVRSLLFGIAATDPATILSVALLLAATATAACLVPAFDAARTDPAGVLRHD
ncbi:MAG TPA: ABC transporter permease [Thermoanaerobaculia bacterium]|nr:ABC transporter permease [Thermoanaerobaculia bacterium]